MNTVAVAAPALTTWAIDSAHSHVEFSVRHLMIATVKGRFSEVRGTVTTDETDPAGGAVDVTIGAASIDTREPKRDEHLRSADFFDVATFPTLTFRSTRIEAVNGSDFTLIGDLTIRGVTREVALAVESHGQATDPWGNKKAGFTATGKIKRGDFGLTWNAALETGGVVVGDEVKITIDAELLKQ